MKISVWESAIKRCNVDRKYSHSDCHDYIQFQSLVLAFSFLLSYFVILISVFYSRNASASNLDSNTEWVAKTNMKKGQPKISCTIQVNVIKTEARNFMQKLQSRRRKSFLISWQRKVGFKWLFPINISVAAAAMNRNCYFNFDCIVWKMSRKKGGKMLSAISEKPFKWMQ